MRHWINYGIAIIISTFLIICSYGHLNSSDLHDSWQALNGFLHDYSIRDSFQESYRGIINEEKEEMIISFSGIGISEDSKVLIMACQGSDSKNLNDLGVLGIMGLK